MKKYFVLKGDHAIDAESGASFLGIVHVDLNWPSEWVIRILNQKGFIETLAAYLDESSGSVSVFSNQEEELVRLVPASCPFEEGYPREAGK